MPHRSNDPSTVMYVESGRLDRIVSATEPDWSREDVRKGWTASKALLASFRTYQRAQKKIGFFASLVRRVAVLRHRYWLVVTGAEIPLNCQIGGGLIMPHPNGIVIHSDCRIGPNCLIFQQVTIGASTKGVPTIGGHVDIGAGAKIIGPITIGDDARIGANAVVTFDVPAGATIVAPRSEILVRTNAIMHDATKSEPNVTP